jgi:hypothetical protein
MKRSHGSGHLYVKCGSYYGRWCGVDGRLVNRKVGEVRKRGEKDGITRAEAERGLRRLIEAESRRPPAPPAERARTVDEVCEALRQRITLEGARLSYRQNCESMQRIHISPAMGGRRIERSSATRGRSSTGRTARPTRVKRRCHARWMRSTRSIALSSNPFNQDVASPLEVEEFWDRHDALPRFALGT